MTMRPTSKLVHEGDYVAEVEVELIEDSTGWSPYLSVADAERLDQVREALRRADLKTASLVAKSTGSCPSRPEGLEPGWPP